LRFGHFALLISFLVFVLLCSGKLLWDFSPTDLRVFTGRVLATGFKGFLVLVIFKYCTLLRNNSLKKLGNIKITTQICYESALKVLLPHCMLPIKQFNAVVPH